MVLYALLIIVGVSNIFRFKSINGMTSSLIHIYIFSMIENVAIIVWLALIPKGNEYSYVPYATMIYMKLIMGISFMHSVFELKFAIDHFFTQTSIEKYKKNLKITFWILIILRLGILCLYATDIYYDFYIKYFKNQQQSAQ